MTRRNRTPEQIEREKAAQAANKAAAKAREIALNAALDRQILFDQAPAALQAASILFAHSEALLEDVEQSYRIDERAAYRFQDKIEKLEGDMAGAKADLDKFTSAINDGDMSRFEWADGAFKSAAALQVLPKVVAMFLRYGRTDEVRKVAIQEMQRYASSFSRSTSPSHNLFQDALRSVWADLFGFCGVLGSLYED